MLGKTLGGPFQTGKWTPFSLQIIVAEASAQAYLCENEENLL
jgi:hypothetical protein